MWHFNDNQENTILVEQNSALVPVSPHPIYQSKNLTFDLLFDENKFHGYRFKYKPATHKFELFNSIALFYARKSKSPKLEVLYEDQTLRLLSYVHPRGSRDYMLIGRWKQDSEG